jgi:hypothetical protein
MIGPEKVDGGGMDLAILEVGGWRKTRNGELGLGLSSEYKKALAGSGGARDSVTGIV